VPIGPPTRDKIRRLLDLQRAARLCWQSSRLWTLASLILSSIQGLLPLLSLYLTKQIIDTLTQGLAGANATPDALWQQVLGLIVLAAAVAIATDGLNALGGLAREAQSQLVTDYVRDLLHAKSVEVDLEYYESAQYYDKLHQAQSEAPYRPPLILNRLIQSVQGAISLSAIATLLLVLHWSATVVLFLAIFPILLVRLRYAQQFYRLWQKWTSLERQANYFSWMLTHESHAKEIRLFDLGGFFQERFRHLRQTVRQGKLHLAARRSLAEAIAQGIATLAVFSAFAFIAERTLRGAMTLGSLVMYYQAFQRGQTLLRETVRNLASLYENSLFLANFYNFLNLQPTALDPPFPKDIPQPLQIGIEFENVQFNYPHSTRPALADITLRIKAGETVALVGENGAGKTTAIKLLCRLYNPSAGQIKWDGIDIREFKQIALRKQISVVFQDYARYSLTVRENIGFGDLKSMVDADKIRSAAGDAGIDAAIARLPQGYETLLGKQFAQGEELSIGEWQKIAIARGFLRQAPILILDEPTSALDPQAEAEVVRHFRQLAHNRTTILISHRLSTVKLADRIFVLEHGRITESGTHAQLIQHRGTYAHLFETQANRYR